MTNHDHSGHEPPPSGSFWRSRTGAVLIAFLAVGALLLAYEHRVHIFVGGWFPAVQLALCVGMHLFQHRGHGDRS